MKKIRMLVVILLVMIAVGGLYRFFVPSYASVLEANWGIELPVKALFKEVYAEDSGPSFHGDGVRYHVFSYKNATLIEEMLPWSDTEGNTLAWSQNNDEEKSYQTYTESADIWLGELDIPEEQYPAYSDCLCWYKSAHDHSEILVFWNPIIYRLYIIENII